MEGREQEPIILVEFGYYVLLKYITHANAR